MSALPSDFCLRSYAEGVGNAIAESSAGELGYVLILTRAGNTDCVMVGNVGKDFAQELVERCCDNLRAGRAEERAQGRVVGKA